MTKPTLAATDTALRNACSSPSTWSQSAAARLPGIRGHTLLELHQIQPSYATAQRYATAHSYATANHSELR